jgi:propanol-preferring alcohol dehydrogenase
MRAMRLERQRSDLRLVDIPDPHPGAREVLIDVGACGVCRTDLHVRDGELTDPTLPLVLGHEIVGIVREVGSDVSRLSAGDRVGVPWLGWVCGTCVFCRRGEENLCPNARFTGYQRDGGYAERTVADERFCFPVASAEDDAHVAPLLCAGLIGHRALRATGDPALLGIYGFGAAAHIVIQIARYEGRRVFAFTRENDEASQRFARALGADWAGGTLGAAPEPLDAAIIFAPAGELVPAALAAVRPGGVVVCAGIHMSDIPSFPYALLWGERSVRSVANLTRRDGEALLALAARVPIHTTVHTYPLRDANAALADVRGGRIEGAAVLLPR